MLFGINTDKNNNIKTYVKSFFENLINFPNISLDIIITNYDEYYYAFGIIEGLQYLLDDFKEDSLISFNITCCNKFYNLINTYCNINEMIQYYKKDMKNLKKNLIIIKI